MVKCQKPDNYLFVKNVDKINLVQGLTQLGIVEDYLVIVAYILVIVSVYLVISEFGDRSRFIW